MSLNMNSNIFEPSNQCSHDCNCESCAFLNRHNATSCVSCSNSPIPSTTLPSNRVMMRLQYSQPRNASGSNANNQDCYFNSSEHSPSPSPDLKIIRQQLNALNPNSNVNQEQIRISKSKRVIKKLIYSEPPNSKNNHKDKQSMEHFEELHKEKSISLSPNMIVINEQLAFWSQMNSYDNPSTRVY